MLKFFKNILNPPKTYQPLPPGYYNYHTPETSPDQFRLHLRIEPNGSGILIVNASSVLHLNQTATEFAYHLMQGKDSAETTTLVAEKFDADTETIRRDVVSFIDQLLYFIRKSDQEPIVNFGFEPVSNFEDISAPYRLDCYITDQFAIDFSLLVKTENLNTEEWKAILKKAFTAGIPHVIFLGGDPCLREDLIELLSYAEELGLVSGLVTASEKLAETDYLEKLIQSGLDHLVFTYNPDDQKNQRTLEKILPLDLFTCVRIELDQSIDYPLITELIELGANAFSIEPGSGSSHLSYLELTDWLQSQNINLVQDMPRPIKVDSSPEPKSASISDQTNLGWTYLCVLSDGEVKIRDLEGRSIGNLNTETWETIWNRRYPDIS